MLVRVGDILLDRDNRRAGREVEVISVGEDSVTIRTVRSIGGIPVEDGTVSVVGKNRIPKAYKHKIDSEGFVENSEEERLEIPKIDVGKVSVENLKNEIIQEIMDLAKDGNEIILNRIEALETRVNSSEYGGAGYWKPTVYCDTSNGDFPVDGGIVYNNYSAMTGSVVTNYPSVEEVLEKILPQTESDEFEYLWNRLATEGENPHEAVVRLVYELLTK